MTLLNRIQMKLLRGAVIFLGILVLAAHMRADTNSPKIQTGYHTTLKSILNIHQGPMHWIKVAGRQYNGVLGPKKCYI